MMAGMDKIPKTSLDPMRKMSTDRIKTNKTSTHFAVVDKASTVCNEISATKPLSNLSIDRMMS